MTAALRSRDVVALAAAVAGTAVAVLAGVLGWRWPTLVAVVVAVLAEPVARPGQLEAVLTRGSLDRLPRSILRMFAVLAAGSSVWTTSSMLPAFGWTAAVFIAANAALVLLLVYVEHARTPIVLMRNVDVPPPDIRPGPPRGVTSRTAAGIGVLELAILVPALLAPGSSRLLWLCGGLAVAVLVLLDCWLVAAARAVGTTLRGPALRRRVQDYLDRSRPEVLVYFGGRRESSYQLTMWLSTLERLPQRTVVLLRDPKVLADLPATSLPVLCVPGSVDLMALDLSSAHVGLFAANVGNSLHVLRLPHLMTVFIGHGDSDKSASSSPFAKAYDEIWVAGPAGRERYRRAQVGVRDEDIVEVGRPQLDGLLATAVRTDHPVPTLLYAPTWEGWNSEQQYTSLDSMGVELVAAALASSPPVRVIYKPHPFTGRRDPRIARADRQIVELLEAANAAGPGDPAMSGLGVAVGGASVSDGFDGAFSHSTRSALETEALLEAAENTFWSQRHPASHAVVPADGPSLFSCFRQADGLVTDISSVLTDFSATGRPYAVTNPTAVPQAEFRAMFPATAGGPVLDPGDGVAPLLDLVCGRVADTFATERASLRADLLGSGAGPAMGRFVAAAEDLVARGRARQAAYVERGVLRSGGFSAGDQENDE